MFEHALNKVFKSKLCDGVLSIDLCLLMSPLLSLAKDKAVCKVLQSFLPSAVTTDERRNSRIASVNFFPYESFFVSKTIAASVWKRGFFSFFDFARMYFEDGYFR